MVSGGEYRMANMATSAEPTETQITLESLLKNRSRAIFRPEYKLRTMVEADACKHVELGVLLRRDKLYRNQLFAWIRGYAQRGIAGLTKSAPALSPLKTRSSGASSSFKKKASASTVSRSLLTDG
jgi:transposase